MKNKLFILSCVVLMVAGTFYSCSKDQPAADEQNNTVQITAADRAVAGRIIEFRRKLDMKKTNPTLKSNEIIAIENARLDVETNFNAYFAFPDEKYIYTKHDSAILTMQVNDESTTTVDNMLNFYEQCYQQVLGIYNNCIYNNKELLFISLKKGELSEGALSVKLNVVMGQRTNNTYPGPFVFGEDWFYGGKLGMCDSTFYMESDAALQLQDYLNSYCSINPPPPYGYRWVVVNDVNNPYQLTGDEYKDENNNNLIFYNEKDGEFIHDELCLDYNEMNFHLEGEHIVIYNLMRITYNKPDNWEFLNCIIQGINDEKPGSQTIDRIRHQNNLYYAFRYLVPILEVEDPTSLSTL